MKLSKQQAEAVKYTDGPALVAAGAGAGKTGTLTAKIAYLIAKGLNPKRILGITFTNKAADEMKTRLIEITGRDPKDFFWVRTFHSASYLILRQHCELLGYQKPLQIINLYQQQKTIEDILKKGNIDKKYAKSMLAEISKAKNSSSPEKHLDLARKKFSAPITEIYELYEKSLKVQNCVDFDNILLMTRNLLRDFPEIKKKYQELFQYILVDEYQDSNDIQEELTSLLLKDGRLFCVGDDWQAVYGFRGSNINHFLNFTRKYKNAKIFKLEQNYRSADKIVKVANGIIKLNENKIDKKCFSKLKGGVVKIYEYADEEEEAATIAQKIKKFHHYQGKTTSYDKFAVIYRTRFCSLAFEKIFRIYNIPYKMVGALGFFERKEILDILSYLQSAVFIKDNASFLRIINTPKRGIGPALLKKIEDNRPEEASLQETVKELLGREQKIFTPKIEKELTNLIKLLDNITKMPPKDAITEIMIQTNYKEHLKQYVQNNDADYTAKIENIDQLIYSAAQNGNLEDFLEEATLIKEDKNQDNAEDTAKVNLLTIHAAKGLEFHTVFIIGCEENLLPHWKSINSDKELSEERRLMYVAATRAKYNLYLSCADYRKGQFNPKSRFLYEIQKSGIV
ncbi:MAG: UvrD-helicase domain-containing protein [Deltaproteobacteria bacterium]|nr:UvrD-helicase domain-containing protein [Deltaproteobacteria bacterium]